MSITEALKTEHQLILQYLDLMEAYVRCDANQPSHSRLLINAGSFIQFIVEFADTFHHAKEENVLFKYLAAPGVLDHCNPVAVMLSEHNQGRELVSRMKNAVSAGNVADLISHIQAYTALLRTHIFKEDNILYPMAERSINDEEKIKLLKEYQIVDEQRNVQAITSKYQTLLQYLQSELN